MTGDYRIVDLNVRIDSRYDYVHRLCGSYRCSAPYDVEIKIPLDDPIFNYQPSEEDYQRIPDLLTDIEGYLEARAFCREVAKLMPARDAFLFHGSAIAVDGNCYIFTAKSKTGKSTHSRLWRELLGDHAIMVNDDKPIIKVMETESMVFGTPWCGKHKLGNNISAPLKAICIIRQSSKNHIRKIEKTEALPMLIQQAHRPDDPAMTGKTLELIDRMNVEYYCLDCNMDISAAELSYNTMKG